MVVRWRRRPVYRLPGQLPRKCARLYSADYLVVAHPDLVGIRKPRNASQRGTNGLLLRLPTDKTTPATWLAGFLVTVVTGSGAALKFLIAGDSASLLIWFSAALFIPSLALALGIWSKSSKLFEVLHVSMWYLALNGIETVDYFGANSDGNIGIFIPLSLVLIVMAFIGRARQIRN